MKIQIKHFMRRGVINEIIIANFIYQYENVMLQNFAIIRLR